jgi:hypothetical protein
MENQTETQAQATTSATQAMLNAIAETILTHMQQMVDSRVERIMATQATAALFNDQLDERIRTIAKEEAEEKIDDMPDIEDEVHDKVAEAMQNIDIDNAVERTFKERVNWEEVVEEHVDDILDDKVEEEIDNVLEDKVDQMLEDKLEEKIREVLINIIKGESK